MNDVRQNRVISRLNARGSVSSTKGAIDANKVVKTNPSGVIDPSLIAASEKWDDRGFNMPVEGLIIVEDPLAAPSAELMIDMTNIDTGLNRPIRVLEAFGPGAAVASLVTTIRLDADGIVLHPDFAFAINAKQSAAGSTLEVDSYYDSVLLQNDVIPLTNSFVETAPARVEPPTVFGKWHQLTFVLTVNCPAGESVSLLSFYVYLDVS